MWADHHQLQVTSNVYNTTVQVLTIDEKGNGSLLPEPFKPDPRMASFSLLPSTKPNGEKMDVEEVWLLYTNGNHYDALIAEDGKIITLGTLESIENSNELNEEDLFDEIVSEKLVIKEAQVEVDNQLDKLEDESMSKKEKDLKIKLTKEVKDHNITKKTLLSLKEEYKSCKEELRNVHEEKERLKTEFNDLNKFHNLNKIVAKETSPSQSITSMTECDICEYPVKGQQELNAHKKKHNIKSTESEVNQRCGTCGYEFTSNNEFRKHIKIKHSPQYNCEQCSFQGSSKIVLVKHMNTTHRKATEQEVGTQKCTECEEQFTSRWNIKNHIRDQHNRIEDCEYFSRGDCRFPDNVCWDKHELKTNKSSSEDNKFTCHSCRKAFNSKNNMMNHRLKDHPDKVKPCRD